LRATTFWKLADPAVRAQALDAPHVVAADLPRLRVARRACREHLQRFDTPDERIGVERRERRGRQLAVEHAAQRPRGVARVDFGQPPVDRAYGRLVVDGDRPRVGELLQQQPLLTRCQQRRRTLDLRPEHLGVQQSLLRRAPEPSELQDRADDRPVGQQRAHALHRVREIRALDAGRPERGQQHLVAGPLDDRASVGRHRLTRQPPADVQQPGVRPAEVRQRAGAGKPSLGHGCPH